MHAHTGKNLDKSEREGLYFGSQLWRAEAEEVYLLTTPLGTDASVVQGIT